MKLINIVEDIKTEESPNLPEENLKELKKGKTILKALKKGKIDIGWKDEKYDISYDITNVYFYWDTYSNKEVFHMEVTNMDIYVEDVKLYNSLVKKTDDSLWDIWNKDSFRSILSRHIGRRFKNFKISSHVSDARLNFILDKPKPINEEMDNKIDKKVKAVYTAFKTGIVKGEVNQHDKYRYVLPDDYTYNMYKQTLSGRDVAVVTPSEEMKIYYLHQNGEEILLPESSYPNTYKHVWNKVSNKTGQYNIYIKPPL